ncbi:leukocyte cell-derived chemotaxin 1 [Paralichthys olivaceus]|uniref:leukocyte cell-derived chemotaxin 1 n=1 Tax=Paralichthys olivaceus TaxID=8255 RepID=UPI003753B397
MEWGLLRCSAAVMAGSSEKVPIASAGPEDLQKFMPPAYSTVAVKPAATGRLLKAGIAVLIAGALLLLLGAVGAFYFWNNNEKHVYNVHYSMSINGKVEEGSMEIDTANNMERFSTSSGAEEAVEVHDFEIGITGIRFSGGEKCYIKTQVKARLPDVETLNKESMTFNLEDEVMPAKFEDDLIWVAADAPLSDSAFLSNKIKDLCGDLPIFWLRPTYSTSGQRKRRAALRQRRQTAAEEEEEDVEAEFNPENPYQRGLEGEQGNMNIDPMLDHQGVCCAECRRGYTHCQRICEPLGGYHPWPYHYRGCRVACRVIMPCNWWVARIMGLV